MIYNLAVIIFINGELPNSFELGILQQQILDQTEEPSEGLSGASVKKKKKFMTLTPGKTS
jgi:hypothetical protein